MHYLYFILICFLWGSSFVLMKKAEVVFDPILIADGRLIGGAVTLGLLWWLTRSNNQARGGRRPVDLRVLPAALLPALVGTAYPFFIQPFLIGKHQDSAFFGMMAS